MMSAHGEDAPLAFTLPTLRVVVSHCALAPMLIKLLAFFFSSSRRHTRYWRDWSSDVCSSDLPGGKVGRALPVPFGAPGGRIRRRLVRDGRSGSGGSRWLGGAGAEAGQARRGHRCRPRCRDVGGVPLAYPPSRAPSTSSAQIIAVSTAPTKLPTPPYPPARFSCKRLFSKEGDRGGSNP